MGTFLKRVILVVTVVAVMVAIVIMVSDEGGFGIVTLVLRGGRPRSTQVDSW